MTDPIQRQIQAGRRYLMIELVTGKAVLSNGRDTFRRPGGPGMVQFVVVDLEEIKRHFETIAPPRETFTLREVSTMAQEKSPTVHSWVKAGVLTPSVRTRDGTRGRAMLFDRTDAFVACLVASLKRQCGLQLQKMQNVSQVLRCPPRQTRRSTRKKKAKSRRS